MKDYYVHENMIIENMIFETFDTPVLRVKSTNGLVFKNNTIVKTENFKSLKSGKPSFYIQESKSIKIELPRSAKDNFDTFNIVDMKKKNVKIRFK